MRNATAELDEATANLLVQISKAGNSSKKLVRLLDVTPAQLRMFFEAIGEADSPAAKSLIAAAADLAAEKAVRTTRSSQPAAKPRPYVAATAMAAMDGKTQLNDIISKRFREGRIRVVADSTEAFVGKSMWVAFTPNRGERVTILTHGKKPAIERLAKVFAPVNQVDVIAVDKASAPEVLSADLIVIERSAFISLSGREPTVVHEIHRKAISKFKGLSSYRMHLGRGVKIEGDPDDLREEIRVLSHRIRLLEPYERGSRARGFRAGRRDRPVHNAFIEELKDRRRRLQAALKKADAEVR